LVEGTAGSARLFPRAPPASWRASQAATSTSTTAPASRPRWTPCNVSY